ncbi:hypothetical protein PQQ86_15355 [Paraburkholderia sediminicola]|uniref:hypothetical protein n=1 Tax=Paraburkholderia sediminicola TaxID=458836 RepID=UPI0038B97912
MTNDTTASLKITVWRAYRPGKALAMYAPSGSNPIINTSFSTDTWLHREVFSWQAREDIWGGLEDDENRVLLMEKLRDEFDALLPPVERNIAKFGRLVEELRPIATSKTSKWTASRQNDPEDPAIVFGINALLAFYNQVAWIYGIFRNAPDASVTIR